MYLHFVRQQNKMTTGRDLLFPGVNSRSVYCVLLFDTDQMSEIRIVALFNSIQHMNILLLQS